MPERQDIKLQRSGEIDLSLFKAISHPERYWALHILNERVASPNELAQELGTSLRRLAYHVRALERLGCIELIDEKQRRGATEHFYRAVRPPFFRDEDWLQIPLSMREMIVGEQLAAMGRDLTQALHEGTFEARPDRHSSWVRMIVDERGWSESMKVLEEACDELMRIQAESRERLVEEEEPKKPIPMAAFLAGFEARSSLG